MIKWVGEGPGAHCLLTKIRGKLKLSSFLIFFIEVPLIYNVVLASGVQQLDSVACIFSISFLLEFTVAY